MSIDRAIKHLERIVPDPKLIKSDRDKIQEQRETLGEREHLKHRTSEDRDDPSSWTVERKEGKW